MSLLSFLSRKPKRVKRGDWTDILEDDHPVLHLPEPPADWVPDYLTRQSMIRDAQTDYGRKYPFSRAEYYNAERKSRESWGDKYDEIIRRFEAKGLT